MHSLRVFGGAALALLGLTFTACGGGGSASSGVTIVSSTMGVATLGQPFQAQLTASGGVAPYYWSVTGGQLPAGLSLDASNGTVAGTPTAAGSFSPTLTVSDANRHDAVKVLSAQVVSPGESASSNTGSNASSQPASQPATQLTAQGLDQYGGVTAAPCPSASSVGAPSGHFYTALSNGRWHLCDPAGNSFWMNGVYDASPDDPGTDYQGVSLATLVSTKYATGFTSNPTFNWALQTVRRLSAWGFNTIAEYGLKWTLPVAQDGTWPTSDHTIPVKLPFIGFISPALYSLKNAGGYAPGPVKNLLAGIKSNVYSAGSAEADDIWDPNWKTWITNDISNDLGSELTGPNHDYLIGINVDDTDNLAGFGAGPDFPTVNNGRVEADKVQPHLGWLILVTAPTQTSNANFGVTYSDPTVYSKLALSQWLSSRYNNNISALNQAWGSDYTTFGSSQSSGGWGIGTGILDEDGTCPAAHGGTCWIPTDAIKLQGASPGLRQDLDDFLLYHAQHYFSTIRAIIASAAPGVLYLGPTTLGSWGAPPRRQILEAAAQSVDVLMLASLPPDCSDCGDGQQRLDFVAQYGGNKPWVNWEGYQAKDDSYMSPYGSASDELQTQSARGQMYSSRMQILWQAADASGVHHIVGLKWWALYDSRAEQSNWGLITPRDDPYDGTSDSPSAGQDIWGYPTGCLPSLGCEKARYGDFVSAVTAANLAVRQWMAGQ